MLQIGKTYLQYTDGQARLCAGSAFSGLRQPPHKNTFLALASTSTGMKGDLK